MKNSEIKIFEKNIKSTINKIKKIGYSAKFEYINGNNSTYIDVIDKDEIIFKLRLSDHDLRPGNYLPAGVINESYYSIFRPVSIESLRFELQSYFSMSNQEKEYLWTNRLMISDPDYPSLTIVETDYENELVNN
jgi:hypothetical protein